MNIAILTVSDRVSTGHYKDLTGPAVEAQLRTWEGVDITALEAVPDDKERIVQSLLQLSDAFDVVLTNGGTGLGPRDVTPEATREVIDREIPGIGEAMRAKGLNSTPFAMLARQTAGQRGKCLIVNLPGSMNGAMESLDAISTVVPHAVAIINGAQH